MVGVLRLFDPRAIHGKISAETFAALFANEEEHQRKRLEVDAKIKSLQGTLFDIQTFRDTVEPPLVRTYFLFFITTVMISTRFQCPFCFFSFDFFIAVSWEARQINTMGHQQPQVYDMNGTSTT